MKLLNNNSLAETVDAVNDALFFGKIIPQKQKAEIAEWIASRQGIKGSYWGMIAPTENDFETGIRVFTGEPIRTGAGTSHILGEEASRLILKLSVKDKAVSEAINASNKGFETAMKRNLNMGNHEGRYCCGMCTPAYWRNLAAGGLKNQKKRLELGMKYLYKMRDGKGRWRRMPFYYTLLALSEINSPLAKEELRYAIPGLEKLLKRLHDKNKYEARRRKLFEQILEMINKN
jgi:hypothetical protein